METIAITLLILVSFAGGYMTRVKIERMRNIHYHLLDISDQSIYQYNTIISTYKRIFCYLLANYETDDKKISLNLLLKSIDYADKNVISLWYATDFILNEYDKERIKK